MNKTKCVVMVGPSGCGKSTMSKEFETQGYEIFSSDEYRRRRWGKEEIQGDPKYIFERLHVDAARSLREGHNIVIDATNIKAVDREALLNQLNALSNKERSELAFIAIDFSDVSLLTCLENNQKRERHVPEHVIAKQFLRFMDESLEKWDYPEGFDLVIKSKDEDMFEKIAALDGRGDDGIENENDFDLTVE